MGGESVQDKLKGFIETYEDDFTIWGDENKVSNGKVDRIKNRLKEILGINKSDKVKLTPNYPGGVIIFENETKKETIIIQKDGERFSFKKNPGSFDDEVAFGPKVFGVRDLNGDLHGGRGVLTVMKHDSVDQFGKRDEHLNIYIGAKKVGELNIGPGTATSPQRTFELDGSSYIFEFNKEPKKNEPQIGLFNKKNGKKFSFE